MRRWVALPVVITAFVAAAAARAPQAQPSLDVLIRNGRILDGSGNPWLRGDVGVREGRITAIGNLATRSATTIIDAAGRFVTPGFIDAHSHAAEGLVRPQLSQAQPLLAQGITTLVANPDGGGPVDLAAQRAELLRGGLGLNVALLVGHGSVRRAVMGVAERAPTPEELDRMRRLVADAMDQGAFGLSTGLFYTPGSYATTEEVVELAKVAAARGGLYTSHIRDEGNYGAGVVAAVQEVIDIAAASDGVGIVTHVKALGVDNWGLAHAITRRIEAARARGVQVFTDQYPYNASSTTLRAALLPGSIPAPTLEQLAQPAPGGEDRAIVETAERIAAENLRRRGGADSIVIAHFRADPALEGQTLARIAQDRGTTHVRTALELIARQSPSIVSFNMHEDDIAHLMRQPYTMTSTDGGLLATGEGRPHPRNYGAFVRKLSRYVREREVITLEHAIRSMTSLTASVFGMKDRGVIREGAAADILVFDPGRVRERATYEEPHQLSEGIDFALVNGVVVIDNGRFTQALPGQVLVRR